MSPLNITSNNQDIVTMEADAAYIQSIMKTSNKSETMRE